MTRLAPYDSVKVSNEPVWIGEVPIHPMTLAETLEFIKEACATRNKVVIHYANAHAVNLAGRHEAFRSAMAEASLVFCDGKSLQWAARALGRRIPERFTPPDWIDDLCAMAASQGYRLYFLGAREGVAARAAAVLEARHPHLQIDTHHGYFDQSSPELVLHRIEEASPQILLVGLGMPDQELLVRAYTAELSTPVMMTVGGMFDFISGYKKRGPRWLTSVGLEWLHRLIQEPRRLGRRYLLGNPQFAWTVARQVLRERVASRIEGRR